MADWSGNVLIACKTTAESTQVRTPSDDLASAIRAFKVGCDVTHLSRFSVSGSNQLRCGRRGQFREALAERLARSGLSGYEAYGERAWSAWETNVGCYD